MVISALIETHFHIYGDHYIHWNSFSDILRSLYRYFQIYSDHCIDWNLFSDIWRLLHQMRLILRYIVITVSVETHSQIFGDHCINWNSFSDIWWLPYQLNLVLRYMAIIVSIGTHSQIYGTFCATICKTISIDLRNLYCCFNPISTEGERYNVPQGYIFVENSWTKNDFKLKFCDF